MTFAVFKSTTPGALYPIKSPTYYVGQKRRPRFCILKQQIITSLVLSDSFQWYVITALAEGVVVQAQRSLWRENCQDTSLRDIVSYAVICRVCPRHGMQIHIQTCTCADQYTYSYLDMSMFSAVCRWVLLGLSIGCVSHPYREQQFSP